MINITKVRFAQNREMPFIINREHGYPEYSFAHFTTGIDTKINNSIVSLPPHSCIIWKPSFPQYFSANGQSCHDWFHFTIEDDLIFDELGLTLNTWMFPKKWHFISEIIEELQEEFYSTKKQRERLMDLKVRELFTKLSRFPETSTDDNTSIKLRHIHNKMLGSLDHPWTVKELASEVSLSPSRFHALYRAKYGISPINDLVRSRIEMAKYEILSTDRSICEIAESLGYNNISHFSRQFKEQVGVSPVQFGKNNSHERN